MIFAVLGLQLWTFLFIGFFGSELLGTYPTLRIAAQILFVAPLIAWAIMRLRGPGRAIDWAILAALCALLIVSFASVDQVGSLETVGLALAYALTFWAMRDLGANPRLRAAVAVAASYALLFWLVMAALWWISEKVTWVQVFGTVPNLESYQVFIWGTANAFPILSLLVIALLAWHPDTLARRVLVGVWLIASIVVVPLSAGRAAWLGFAVAAVSYEGLSGWPRRRRAVNWLRTRRLVVPATAVGLAALALTVVLVALKGPALLEANLSDRFQIWSQALGIFAADPLTGGGPGTYSWLRLVHVPDYTFPVTVRLAHNVAMLTLADGGLLLSLAFIGLLVVFLAAVRPHLADPRRRVTFAVLLGFAAASLLDDFSSLPAVIAIVVGLAGWAVLEEPVPMRAVVSRRIRPALLPAALLIFSLVVMPSVIAVDTARTAAADARDAAVRGQWNEAVRDFTMSANAHPRDAAYWLGLGLVHWKTGNVEASWAAYQEAADLSPGDPRPWGALAALTSNSDERIRLLDRASRLTMTDPQFAFRLGDALESAGQRERAQQAYGLAVAIDSRLAQAFSDVARRTESTLRPGLETVGLAAIRVAADVDGRDIYISPDVVRWDVGLVQGVSPADAGAAWRAVLLADSGDLPAARAAADRAKSESPYDVHTVNALLVVARFACDRPEYERISSYLGPYVPQRPSAVAVIREHTYREDGLGGYQPLATDPLPTDQRWPSQLIGPPPDCPGWASAGTYP
jgi:tetratricopeptide (TPR) repeat protein/O-antigen ligase